MPQRIFRTSLQNTSNERSQINAIVTDKVGKIKAISPLEGVNLEYILTGSSISSEIYFTLQLIGEKGDGWAKIHYNSSYTGPPEDTEYKDKIDDGEFKDNLFAYKITETSQSGEIPLKITDCLKRK